MSTTFRVPIITSITIEDLVLPVKMFSDVENPYGYVYLTVNLYNRKFYVGRHKSTYFDFKYLGSGSIVRNIINKYGSDYLISVPIEWCSSNSELNQSELYWIKKLNAVESEEFYNLIEVEYGKPYEATGTHKFELGNIPWNTGMKMSYDFKKRVSEGLNSYFLTHDGVTKGIPLSEEHKQKLSEAHTGKVLSEEHRQKISKSISGDKNGFFNKKHSEESKEKMSLAKKEYFKTHSAHNLGVPSSKESKEKNRISHLGKKSSEETKKKISNKVKGGGNANATPIVQLDLNGNFIAEYQYMGEPIKLGVVGNVDISACCRGITKTAGGYKWMYKSDYYNTINS